MILIAGGTGYLGSNLAKFLSEEYLVVVPVRTHSRQHHLSRLPENIITYNVDENGYDALFHQYSIQAIINCAADYGHGRSDVKLIESNLLYPMQLLEYAIKYNIKKIIHTGTSLPANTNNYALSKSQLLPWLEKYSQRINIDHVISEYFYGPYDDEWKFVSMICSKLKKKESFINLSSGRQRRDFIYIDDLCEAYKYILKNDSQAYQGVQNWKVGSGETIALRDLVLKCASLSENFETDLRFGALEDRQNELDQQETDQTDIKKLGWNPKTDLETGINRVLKSIDV